MLKTYTGYQRSILAEVMSEPELKMMDDLYNFAKILRVKKIYKKMMAKRLKF
jgi:hypothetical protein